MKALNNLIIAGTIVALQGYLPANAQDSNNNPSVEELRSVRQDKVKPDLTTVAGRKDKEYFFRTATINESGTYDVVIKDENDRLRMTGHYIDEALTIADGPFTYYYPNGNVESTGDYAEGLKTGTWLRYHADGTPKAEKNYAGMTWENMAVTLGEASKAETH
jgi:antitoxin component YwqK of YwqJK toxin-antitoxin module